MRGMWVASLLLMGGCTSGDPPGDRGPLEGPIACGRATAFDATVFAALTATTWQTPSCQDDGNGLPPTCTTLQLAADGSFSWRAVSDVVERDQAGAWNFLARSETAGIVCLDSGAVIAFELGASSLAWGYLGMQPAEPLAATTHTRADLPAVRSVPLFAQLSEHAWVKTNAFDLHARPEAFRLAADGSYTASYRGGQCEHDGRWSLDLEPRTIGEDALLFIPIAAPNTCDMRGNTTAQIGAANEQPTIDAAGRLRLYAAAYRSPDRGDGLPWFQFDSYGEGVELAGTLDRALTASAPTRIELELTNRGELPRTLSTLTVETRRLTLVTDGFQGEPAIVLATLDLGSQLLAPAATTRATVTVSPAAAAEWASLELRLSYADERQSYQAHGSFVGSIAP